MTQNQESSIRWRKLLPWMLLFAAAASVGVLFLFKKERNTKTSQTAKPAPESSEPSDLPTPSAPLQGYAFAAGVQGQHPVLAASPWPVCKGLLQGSKILGQAGVRVMPIRPGFEVRKLEPKELKQPLFTILKSRRWRQLKAGAVTKSSNECWNDDVNPLQTTMGTPPQDAMEPELLFVGAKAPKLLHWEPLNELGSGPAKDNLLNHIKPYLEKLAPGAQTNESMTAIPVPDSRDSYVIWAKFTLPRPGRECEGGGSLSAVVGADSNRFQLIQFEPFTCQSKPEAYPFVMPRGLLSVKQGQATERHLIFGVGGYESASVASLPISEDGSLITELCGIDYVSGCD